MTGKVVHILSDQPYDHYVGRANTRYGLQRSIFANPYTVEKYGREEALRLYEKRIHKAIDAGGGPAVRGLRGKILACWCAPKDGHLTTEDETVCHAQILLRLAEEVKA